MRDQLPTLTPATTDVTDVVQYQPVLAAIERATTLADAKANDDKVAVLELAVRRDGANLQAANQLAAIRLQNQRDGGRILLEQPAPAAFQRGTAPLPHGLSKTTASRWRKLAQIPEDEFQAYLVRSVTTGSEITQRDALKLAPTASREERANIADTYAAPPVDIEIARQFGLDTNDELAELLTRSINAALTTMPNPRHVFVWCKYTGISDDGKLGDSWTFDGIAKQMGTTREYVESLFYRASHHVRGRLFLDTFTALKENLH